MSYRAPLQDIEFVLNHVSDLGSLLALPNFAHVEAETVAGALAEAARFMEEVIAPTNRPGDLQGSIHDGVEGVTTPDGFKEAYAKFVESGWGALPMPEEFGGAGLPWVVGLAVQEMLTSANMAFSLCPMLTMGGVEAILRHGTDQHRALFLDKLVTHEWTGTMVLTESQAGSDVGAIRTKADPNDDGTWSITGNKIYITWGEHDLADNIIHLVLARAPEAPPGTRGISMFVVPKYLVNDDGSLGERNGVKAVSVEHKLGIHASPTCVLSFEGATGYLIGEVNQGMKYMFTMMNNARILVGLEGLAIAERSYQQARQFAQERVQGRPVGAPRDQQVPIVEHADVRRMLLTMKAHIEAMRCLLYASAEAFDLAHNHPEEQVRDENREFLELLTPISKAWSTDLGVELTSIGLQVHGGMGYVEETGSAQHFRDARIAPIYEGTNGIQAMDLVARKLPLNGGTATRRLLQQMQETVAALPAVGMEAGAEQLGQAVAALTDAIAWLAANGPTEPNDALAGATPFLRLMGTVVGGWLMAKSAIAARHLLDDGHGDAGFLEAKLATADFYLAQLLPQASALVPAVTAGYRQLGRIPADRF
jgi:alkylation response protein AidB-like acyl-CoA dehydrogenase